jgi:tetratricopeptide (TPR) repeat protein
MARDLVAANKAAKRAVALDDRDPYSHYALFGISLLHGRHQIALAEAQRSIDLNPNFALGHLALGWARIYTGHFAEALDPLLRALRLSPNDPMSFLFFSQMALYHYHLGNYEESLHYAERALSVRQIYIAQRTLLASLGQLGRMEEATDVLA